VSYDIKYWSDGGQLRDAVEKALTLDKEKLADAIIEVLIFETDALDVSEKIIDESAMAAVTDSWSSVSFEVISVGGEFLVTAGNLDWICNYHTAEGEKAEMLTPFTAKVSLEEIVRDFVDCRDDEDADEFEALAKKLEQLAGLVRTRV
jgi:hypothetical protein